MLLWSQSRVILNLWPQSCVMLNLHCLLFTSLVLMWFCIEANRELVWPLKTLFYNFQSFTTVGTWIPQHLLDPTNIIVSDNPFWTSGAHWNGVQHRTSKFSHHTQYCHLPVVDHWRHLPTCALVSLTPGLAVHSRQLPLCADLLSTHWALLAVHEIHYQMTQKHCRSYAWMCSVCMEHQGCHLLCYRSPCALVRQSDRPVQVCTPSVGYEQIPPLNPMTKYILCLLLLMILWFPPQLPVPLIYLWFPAKNPGHGYRHQQTNIPVARYHCSSLLKLRD